MADSDDKTQDGAHKKTLTLKGGASAGMRPGMSRGPRTVVVEKRTRVVPHGNAGAGASVRPSPAGTPSSGASARPQSPSRDTGRSSRPSAPPAPRRGRRWLGTALVLIAIAGALTYVYYPTTSEHPANSRRARFAATGPALTLTLVPLASNTANARPCRSNKA